MAVGTYALTSLANIKAWLGISGSTDDTVLESAIDRATSMIESYTGRQLKSRTQYEWRMPNGERTLTIDHAPIVSIRTVSYGRQTSFTVNSTTASTDVLATVGFDGTNLRLEKVDASGTSTSNTLAATSYVTTSQLVTQINSSVTGWTATLSTNAYTRSLYRFGGRGVKDAHCDVSFPRDNVSEYEVEHDIGLIHITADRFPGVHSDDAGTNRFPSGFFPVFVEYTGGYSTVPNDLEQVCIEMAADMYNDRKADRNLTSEALGDYNYSRKAELEMATRYDKILTAYREVR